MGKGNTVTVEVDVDLGEFQIGDLADEIIGRISKAPSVRSDLDEIYEELSEFFDKPEGPELATLLDKEKWEHLTLAFEKYSLEQLQALIPV